MKHLLTFTLSLLFSLICLTQGIAQEHHIERNRDSIVTSVRFNSSDADTSIPVNEQEFFKTYLAVSPDDQFVQVPHTSKRPGFIHDHFDQYYKGVRVVEGGYNFHYKDGRMYFANGHYVKIADLNVVPRISVDQAVAAFLKYKGIGKEQVDDAITEILVKEVTKIIGRDTVTPAVLVYRIYLISGHKNNDEVGYVDAHTGEIVMTEPRLISLLGTFQTRYSGTRQADTDPVSGGHRLYDNTRGATIHTRNLQNTYTSPSSAVELIDNDNNWTTAEHGGNNNDMGLDVHWGLQEIYDYMDDIHGINSFDDAGHAIEAYVRFGDNDDDRDNAFWNSTLNVLYFGQGGVNFTPLASIDVVAHEFGHGITDFQIGWTGSGQQRAFNEGLSDIWGAIFESRIRPSSTWRIGEQVTKNKSFLRNLQDTNDGNALQLMADTYLSTQYNSATGTDWFYVRSGVFSHWFYILVNGESGTNDLGNSYSVQGVGIDVAEELIFEAVFNNCLDNTTSYPEIRTAIIAIAEATFCEEDPILKSITDAWYAVGVGAAFTGTVTTLSGPDDFCTSDTYTVSGLPTGATVAWSANPSGVTFSGSGSTVTVTRAGTFNGKVTLTATVTGSCGTYDISKEVQVGTPTPEITNIYVYPEYNQIDVLINTVPGATSYEYYIDGVLDGSTLGSSHVYSFYGVPCGYTYHMSVRAIGPCGPSWEDVDFAYLPCVSPFTVSPNPANGSLTVSAEVENAAAKSAGNQPAGEFNVKLYNGQGRLLREADSMNGSVTLDTQELPEGTHYLHISRGKETVKRQVVIKH